jgi:predicted lipoprotein with Yx(FWY)xxD motif
MKQRRGDDRASNVRMGATRHTFDSADYEETNTMEQTKKMQPVRRRIPLVRVAAATMGLFSVSALLLAPDTAHAASNHATAGIVVSTAKNSQFGTILVSGRALYTLTPSSTACGTKCLKIWPALMLPKGTTKAIAGSGVNAAKLGTVKRANGALQVTYGGKALYWFYKDSAGKVKGNLTDTWGKWTVVVTKKAAGGGGTTTTSPGGGGVGF